MRVLAERAEWMTDAACRGMDPDIFVVERGQSVQLARRTCADCPVAQECLDYAVENAWLSGIWGSLGQAERRRMRARRAVEA